MAPVDARAARASFTALHARAKDEYEALFCDEAWTVMVGTATCGRSAGALDVLRAFKEQTEALGIETRVIEVGCMGHCYAEPLALVKRPGWPPMFYHHLDAIIARNVVKMLFVENDPYLEFFLGATDPSYMLPLLDDYPRYHLEHRLLLRRCGLVDPEDARQAVALGAYAGFVRALEMEPEAIVEALRVSGLRGLGGAGFPTWRKWDACRKQAEQERHLICNADEGDPGAFMDRTLLESDPHAVLEGLLVGGLAIGCPEGLVYVRAEYPLAVQRLRAAIASAEAAGLLGEDVLGSGLSFRVEVVEGAGAFVCGESSALMHSIEGERGMPRTRPPQSVERGLHGKPTVLNNVKTLAAVGPILADGPERFAEIGTRGSKGTAVFALAGKITSPGLVEVPMGTTLRELIFDIGGGPPRGKRFKAVQIGGPSGGCLPEAWLDTPIDFDALGEAGSMMGSGGMVVLDEDNCMVDAARYFLEFTQRESCGKCSFCRIGTRHLLDILTRITEGRGEMRDLDTLQELSEEIQAGSLCNLGKTAPNPILTGLRFFREEYEAHIAEKRCPACVCRELTAYYIEPSQCARGCDACVGSCPPEAIYTTFKRVKAIDQSLCVKCDSCVSACPPEYDAVVKISPIVEVPPAPPRPLPEDGP
ncbi:MAG: SLBB domain-containing protein [Deltaproteobacteria bacterium]|nr:SLBB domain-containing protein [Deltaproteobacteria bacterium]